MQTSSSHKEISGLKDLKKYALYDLKKTTKRPKHKHAYYEGNKFTKSKPKHKRDNSKGDVFNYSTAQVKHTAKK
jgi:hypothetical protein